MRWAMTRITMAFTMTITLTPLTNFTSARVSGEGIMSAFDGTTYDGFWDGEDKIGYAVTAL